MGGSKYGLAVCLLGICTPALMDYQDWKVCLQKSASLLFRPSQSLSGWTDTVRGIQRSFGSDWSTWGPSQMSLTNSVMDLCRWWEVMRFTEAKLLSGHSKWLSSALVWIFWNFLTSANRSSTSVSTRSLFMLVLDTQLEGLIQTDETLSKSPPVNWIYFRRRRLCTCRTRQRWKLVEYKYLAVWSQGGRIQILSIQSRNILIT